MEYEFRVGDRAVTRTDTDIIEKYAGLTCTIVSVSGYNDWLRIVFDDDPNGVSGRIYSETAGSLIPIVPDFQIDMVSSFIDDM